MTAGDSDKPLDRGLRAGALGLFDLVVIAVAGGAPPTR